MDWSCTRLTLPRPETVQASTAKTGKSTGWTHSPKEKEGSEDEQWMDWVASSIEFFGCEGGGGVNGTGRSVIGRALMLQRNLVGVADEGPAAEQSTSNSSGEKDYTRLHEDFFEALLREQAQEAGPNPSSGKSSDAVTADSVDDDILSEPVQFSHSRDDSMGTLGSSVSSSSSHTHETCNSVSSTRTHKRRRPFRLSPRRSRPTVPSVSPLEAYDAQYNPEKNNGTTASSRSSANQLSLSEILLKEDLHEPHWYVHPNCVLQKDKGKGEPLGNAISANGRDACLNKLREKMAIVVQVSSSSSKEKESTGMKRRPAKVAQRTSTLVETRSMIEVRMGFLSVQYGLLLHWDHRNGNKVVFIALRKMCHDSFYTKIPALLSKDNKQSRKERKAGKRALAQRQLEQDSLPLVLRTSIGNHAICQRSRGTEVVLVDEPHRIKPPVEFAPSKLSVKIHSISGLSKQSRWTLSMTFDGHTELAQLHYNNERGFLESRRIPMMWKLSPETVNSFELAGLEIRLFEYPHHRSKKNKAQTSGCRLTSSMTLPLGELVAQPSSTPSTSLQLTLPFTHNPATTQLTLELVFESEYAFWLFKELHARQVEEVQNKSMFALSSTRKLKNLDDPDLPDLLSLSSDSTDSESSEEEKPSSDDMVDWFCGVCFKEYYLP